MKILHIHPTMRSGGIEAIICALVNEMSILHDVTMCTIFTPTASDVFYNKISPRVHKKSIGKNQFGFSLREIFKIYKLIKNGGFDVVHIHGCFYYYLLSVLLLHNKIKFFYTIHSNAYMENVSWDKYLVRIKKLCFKKKWVRAVTISNASQESFYELYGCKSYMIYNGIEPPIPSDNIQIKDFKITTNTKVFIHPGRISEAKNQVVLCKVFANLIKKGYDIILVIYGGIEDEKIYNEIKGYFSDRIRYNGISNDIPSLMAQADAFVLPSIWEGLPVTLLEALSVGCIPICSPVGGIVNVIEDGINGILSKSSDEADYYMALDRFISMSDEDIKSMRKAAINSFEKYTIHNTSKEYIKAYLE